MRVVYVFWLGCVRCPCCVLCELCVLFVGNVDYVVFCVARIECAVYTLYLV